MDQALCVSVHSFMHGGQAGMPVLPQIAKQARERLENLSFDDTAKRANQLSAVSQKFVVRSAEPRLILAGICGLSFAPKKPQVFH